MGISGISVGSLLVILLIVVLLFGTKRLRTIGSDLGGALNGFRRALKEGEEASEAVNATLQLERDLPAGQPQTSAAERSAS